MQTPSRNTLFAYGMILTLVGSVFSVAFPMIQQSYASHENITLDVADAVTKDYDPEDSVTIEGLIDDVVDNEDVTIKVLKPSGVTDTHNFGEPDSHDRFDWLYEIPSNGVDGVWTFQVDYDGDKAYSYFIVNDDADTIDLELDQDDGIYEAGDQVTITGRVDTQDDSEEDVEITVLDPTNDEIVDSVKATLGEGSGVDDDEFKYSFDLDDDAGHGRYAVTVTYDFEDQEGSMLFEILDDDSGSGSGSNDGDSDEDGDLLAEIDNATYQPGDNVALSGSIDGYQSSDDEDLEIVVEDPNGDEVDDYGDSSASVQSDGDFEYDFDLDDNADEGTYTVIISYINDEVQLDFEVDDGSGTGGGGSTNEDLTAKLNKSSYLAGETMTVTGTVKDVADPDDEEFVSIFVYHPDGKVILEASKYVTPSSNGAYTATISLSSKLETDDDYKVKVSYLEDEVTVLFDITGVSSTPSDEITVNTDKDKYEIGSTVKIAGDVPSALIESGQQLLVRVNTPVGDPCRLDPVEIPSSGDYSYSLVLGGKCGIPGHYKVEVTYNGKKSSTTFELLGTSDAGYLLTAGSKTYTIDYELSSGTLKGMSVNPSEDKLVVRVTADADGKLTLVLPRAVIDAVEGGEDVDYVVTIEDESGNIKTVDVEESENTDTARTLEIDYQAGADRIEITGTQVVPEFGTIAAIILAVAIVGIIVATGAYSNRFGLFFRH